MSIICDQPSEYGFHQRIHEWCLHEARRSYATKTKRGQRLQRLFSNADPNHLNDVELLQLMLATVAGEDNAKRMANALIASFGSLGGVLGGSLHHLKQVPGITELYALQIQVIAAIGVRMVRCSLDDRPIISSPQMVTDYCRAAMAHKNREMLRVLFLNMKNRLIADEVQQIGTINYTAAYPREIVRRAIELDATAVILAHNHPSGDPTPSGADIEMTDAIAEALRALDIVLLDHIIVARQGHVSLLEQGLYLPDRGV